MTRGFSIVALDRPKIGENVGGAWRAAHCFYADMLVLAGARHKSMCTDTTKAFKHIPLLEVDDPFDALPRDCVPIAVDLYEDAQSLENYAHPERAMYIFGPEDGFVRKEIKARCRDSVFIPTSYCLNLASTVNVVLYDRNMKRRKIK